MAMFASLLLLIFAFDVAMGQSACPKLDRDVEIVFVLDASLSVKPNDYASMISTVRQFPDLVQMGEQHVRVAIVVFDSSSNVAVELTADIQLVRHLSANQSLTPDKQGTSTHLALKQVKEIVLAKARPNAMRVVVLITDGMPTIENNIDTGPTEAAAKSLRNANVVIYAAYVGNVTPEIRKHLEIVTNESSHVMPVANFSELAVVIKEKLMKAIECAYEEVCYFGVERQCLWEWRRPNVSGICCTNEPPKGGPNCDAQKCKATCDQWQWANDLSACDQKKPGETIKIQRQGPRPADKKFAYCPETMEVVCDPSTEPPIDKVTSPLAVTCPPCTQAPLEPTCAPSSVTCSSNPGVSFGLYLGNAMQCMQSKAARLWTEKTIVDLLYQANEAEASGKFGDFKRLVDDCMRAVGA